MGAISEADEDKLILSEHTKFIINTDDNSFMAEEVKGFAKKAERLDFLVGYFVFSGFKEIYKSIEHRPLRILVGMDVDVVVNRLVEKYSNSDKSNVTRKGLRERFEKLQIAALNMSEFDNLDTREAAKFFLDKLLKGELEIRKTEDPNHAKMYLFSYPCSPDDDRLEGRALIGSSNLSYQGLLGRNEINVLLKDDNDYSDASKIFEYLWKKSKYLVLADKKTDPQLLEKTWVSARPTPYLMYIRALQEYFSVSTGEFKTPRECSSNDKDILDIAYQTDAIKEALYKINKHHGCIIADVVGLGKTIVAATIAANLNLKTVIICPPHLKEQWEYEKERFGVNASVFGSGKESIEDAVNKFYNKKLLVIVDEAHRYRNERSATYAALHQLCVGNKVILLSATPFNNSPQDIFSLVKLFQIPTHATIQTVNNLAEKMTELFRKYRILGLSKGKESAAVQQAELAREIRDILDPVMIRRTRTDLLKVSRYEKDLKSQNIEFSGMGKPRALEYELGDLAELYIDTLEIIKPTDPDKPEEEDLNEPEGNASDSQGKKKKKFRFRAARYCALNYLKEEFEGKYKKKRFSGKDFHVSQSNLATFMQRMLVRRFESCPLSFYKSLGNLHKSCEKVMEWLTQKHVIPVCKSGDLPDILEFEDSDLLDEDSVMDLCGDFTAGPDEKQQPEKKQKQGKQKRKKQEELFFVNENELNDRFKLHLRGDIDALEKLMKDWKEKTNDFKVDPKLKVLTKELEKSFTEDKKRKIIIFTEFNDTADYLNEELEKRKDKLGRPLKYGGKQKNVPVRRDVRGNFDASLPASMQENEYHILVATDAISEGYSLHRAGTIYNYDIPYNPTRVIQRVGRIDRISKKKTFDELFVYNFFPSAIGEELAHQGEIAKFKLEFFQILLGADAQLLSDNETPEGYLSKKILEEDEGSADEAWRAEFLNEFHQIENNDIEAFEKAKIIPPRTRISRLNAPAETKRGVYVFAKKGDDCRFAFASSDDPESDAKVLSPGAVLKAFKADKKEEPLKDVSNTFYKLYEKACSGTGKAKPDDDDSSEEFQAAGVLGLLLKENPEEEGYLKKLISVVRTQALPKHFYPIIRKGDFDEIKQKISEKRYLDKIRDELLTISSLPQSIVLSEEIQ